MSILLLRSKLVLIKRHPSIAMSALERCYHITSHGIEPIPTINTILSLTATKGKLITENDIYSYTNGHFLLNESEQLARRYVKFKLEKLCEIAASVMHSKSPITAIEKFEGGFSKALIMKSEDGTEVVAKIPCSNAGPRVYTTASEVAVLQYSMLHFIKSFSNIRTNPAKSNNAPRFLFQKFSLGTVMLKIL